MNKQEFLYTIKTKLTFLPEKDAEEWINFYSEAIDDRIEDGVSEDTAVEGLGSVNDIVSQIIAETPFVKLAKERVKPRKRLSWWEITLLALGSPIWISLLVSVFSVVLALYVTSWSLVASAWAIFGAVIACAPAGMAIGIGFAISGNALSGMAVASMGIACAGIAIFLFFGCKAATKGIVCLTGKLLLCIKKCFIGKGKHDENNN